MTAISKNSEFLTGWLLICECHTVPGWPLKRQLPTVHLSSHPGRHVPNKVLQNLHLFLAGQF